MELVETDRGFFVVIHDVYPPDPRISPGRVVQESSAIGDYEDSFDCPGSSFLWVGNDFHLNREEVSELVRYLETWLSTGRLSGEEKR